MNLDMINFVIKVAFVSYNKVIDRKTLKIPPKKNNL